MSGGAPSHFVDPMNISILYCFRSDSKVRCLKLAFAESKS
jgi:hypothetical protein